MLRFRRRVAIQLLDARGDRRIKFVLCLLLAVELAVIGTLLVLAKSVRLGRKLGLLIEAEVVLLVGEELSDSFLLLISAVRLWHLLCAVGASTDCDRRVAADVGNWSIGRADSSAGPERVERRLVELDPRVLLRRWLAHRREYLFHARPGRVRH